MSVTATTFLGQKFGIFLCFLFPVSSHPRKLLENHYSDVKKVQFSFSDCFLFVIEGFIPLKFQVISKEFISRYKYNTVLLKKACTKHTKPVAKSKKMKVVFSVCLILTVKQYLYIIIVHLFSLGFFP